MGLARSTFYNTPLVSVNGDEPLAHIGTICDECRCYGYQRVSKTEEQQIEPGQLGGLAPYCNDEALAAAGLQVENATT